MVWFLERNTDRLTCEIRLTEDQSPMYEFEIAPTGAPARTQRFASATELIDTYLREQSHLRAQGWRPRASDVDELPDC